METPIPAASTPAALDKLTAKQRTFVREYIKDHNASAAYLRAGYTTKNPGVVGPRMLGLVGVRRAINELDKEALDISMITAEYVLTSLQELAERCLQREPVMEFNKVTKRMECTGEWKFDSAGASRALELLGKYLALFTEKHEVTGAGGKPLIPAPRIELKAFSPERLERLLEVCSSGNGNGSVHAS